MKRMALQGVIRGKRLRTTVSDRATPCPLDHVHRQFRSPRPNVLWVSDFTYFATWTGFVYVAFVIDAFARKIVGWRASRTAHAGFVLDALEQAIHDRRPVGGGLVHHSDRGVQYASIKYTGPATNLISNFRRCSAFAYSARSLEILRNSLLGFIRPNGASAALTTPGVQLSSIGTLLALSSEPAHCYSTILLAPPPS